MIDNELKSQVIGYYNARMYRITVDGEEIYQAGNSPYESTVFIRPCDGVGLNRMKKYCIITAKEIAEENNAQYIGVEYQRIVD
jgi:hypothetical protein